MLKRKKYKIYPPILSNKGQIIQDIWLSGSLSINDIDNVLISEPLNDGDSLVYSASMGAWVNQPTNTIYPWLNEFHTIGESLNTITQNIEYCANNYSADLRTWNDRQWDVGIINTANVTTDALNNSGAFRAIPQNNITKLFIKGNTSVILNSVTEIKIYRGPCFNYMGTAFSFPTYELLGNYVTPIFSDPFDLKDPALSCFEFEIDINDVLGRSLTTDDTILVTVSSVENTTSPKSISISPFSINYAIGYQTSSDS